MSNESICPTTLEGIKRLAKSIKRERGIKHQQALDEAAKRGGFENFRHASNTIGVRGAPSHSVLITAYWKDRETGVRGRETLAISLSEPWADLITPAQFQYHRGFNDFRAEGPDHLARSTMTSSQSAARRMVCAAARSLQFIDATKLRPSKSHSKAYPGGRWAYQIPGRDHGSVWYDRDSKRYLYVDEPYEKAAERHADERTAWARHHDWIIMKPYWAGMYDPGGGSRLYLIADAQKGIPLDPVASALNRLPAAITEETWNGESAPMLPYFVSPGTIAKAAAEATARENAKKIPRRKAGKRNTVGYTWAFVGPQRRPDARMPITAHAEVGRLLKSVLAVAYHRKGVYNRVDAIRGELDEWTQREYSRAELPDDQFFDLYYGDNPQHSGRRSLAPEERAHHAESLTRVRTTLATHYPDCPPLRAMLKRTDAAITSLQNWTS